MNPTTVIAALLALAGAAYGYDQRQKREQEKERSNEAIEQLSRKVREKQQQLDRLVLRLGKQHWQVQEMAAEIQKLRQQLAKARDAA